MRLMSAIVLLLMSGCSAVHSDDANYKVLIHGNEECNYDYGVEDFCDEYNQISYKNTDKTVNFDKDKVLVVPKDNFGYLVVINPETQIAYPFGYLVNYKKLIFSKNSNEFCIEEISPLIVMRIVDTSVLSLLKTTLSVFTMLLASI